MGCSAWLDACARWMVVRQAIPTGCSAEACPPPPRSHPLRAETMGHAAAVTPLSAVSTRGGMQSVTPARGAGIRRLRRTPGHPTSVARGLVPRPFPAPRGVRRERRAGQALPLRTLRGSCRASRCAVATGLRPRRPRVGARPAPMDEERPVCRGPLGALQPPRVASHAAVRSCPCPCGAPSAGENPSGDGHEAHCQSRAGACPSPHAETASRLCAIAGCMTAPAGARCGRGGGGQAPAPRRGAVSPVRHPRAISRRGGSRRGRV
jgi:hypothetical protein